MRLRNEGAKAQRLLWASTGTKDPDASDVLYIEGLVSPFTVNTMPEKTLDAFADHGEVGETLLGRRRRRRRDAQGVQRRRDRHRRAGDQAPGGGQAEAFVESWNELLNTIATQTPSAGIAR